MSSIQRPEDAPVDEDVSLEPAEGSFPFQFSVDDFKKVLVSALMVGLAAMLGFLVEEVLPSLQIGNIYVMAFLPVITAGLESLRRWLVDTRPKAEQRQLPYKQYLKIRALRAR